MAFPRPLRFAFTALAATAALAGCTQTPSEDPTIAKAPADAATVVATTTFGQTVFTELQIKEEPAKTCFTVTSSYKGDDWNGDIDCVDGNASASFNGKASVLLLTSLQEKTNVFKVSPATRPDVRCFVTASTTRADQGSGHLRCMKVAATP